MGEGIGQGQGKRFVKQRHEAGMLLRIAVESIRRQCQGPQSLSFDN